MSWNLFNRSSKRSVISKTEERDYERECTKLHRLEESSKKLYKDSKRATAANEAFGKASAKLGQDLVQTLGVQATPSLESLKVATTKQKQQLEEKRNITQLCWTEATKKYNTIFPYCSQQLKSRDKALQEYSKVQAKMDKYQEKEQTAAISVKVAQVKRELQPVKKDFAQKNTALMNDIPRFCDARFDYFYPSLQASIESDYWLRKETIQTFKSSLTEMNADKGHKADVNVRNCLEEIRKLSITTDD